MLAITRGRSPSPPLYSFPFILKIVTPDNNSLLVHQFCCWTTGPKYHVWSIDFCLFWLYSHYHCLFLFSFSLSVSLSPSPEQNYLKDRCFNKRILRIRCIQQYIILGWWMIKFHVWDWWCLLSSFGCLNPVNGNHLLVYTSPP